MKIFKSKKDRRQRIRFPIAIKILFGFIVAMLFMLLSNFLILHRMNALNEIVSETGRSVNRVSLEREIIQQTIQLRKLDISYDNALQQKHKDEAAREFIRTTPDVIRNNILKIHSMLDSLKIPKDSTDDEIYSILNTIESSIKQHFDELHLLPKLSHLQSAVEKHLSSEQKYVNELVIKSKKITSGSAQYGILLSLGMLLLSAITALIIAGRIAKPIANLRRATHYARLGKYNQRVPFTSHDEIADLTADFNAMMSALGKLDKMKAVFLSSITHDLKSPLYRVKLGLENLQDEIHGTLTQEQKHAVDNLLDDVDTLSRLIYDILDIQKMEDGKFELHRSRVNLVSFVRDTVKKHSISFADKGVGLTLRLNVNSDVEVFIDIKQIERVFENLLSNALKFTHKGGVVTVSTEHKNHLLYFSIKDTGAGIPQDEVDKIFDKFFRASTGKNVRGTGLGLAIAKQIITAHGGRIWAESELGRGTIFNFVIPVGAGMEQVKNTNIE